VRVSRRSLSLALAGLFAGVASQCKRAEPGVTGSESTGVQAPASAAAMTDEAGAKACCMGLNDCKGKGGCAVPESHACRGQNECKGRGGCNMHCPK
jgi:hypothetical protein